MIEHQPTPEEVAATIRRADAEAEKFRNEAAFFAQQSAREKAITEKHDIELRRLRRDYAREQMTNSENRVYEFTGHVTSTSAEYCMARLSMWRRENGDPITIRFSSPGGSVIDGLALFDYIQDVRRQGIHVTTSTLGMAASMACVLLQAGDDRVMGANAHILIHEVSSGAIGKLSEMEDETKFTKRVNRRLYDILATRSKMGWRSIERRAKRKDWWLSSEEALHNGFCDRVG